MLVLSRKRGEQIMLGDHVVVTVIEIRGDKVRLGIEAPQDVPVHRSEVYEAIVRSQALQHPPSMETPSMETPSGESGRRAE